MSTSAFLQTMLANRRPIPLMAVMAYMTFCLPSTLVFSTRRMCWNSSPATRDCAAGTDFCQQRDGGNEVSMSLAEHSEQAFMAARPPPWYRLWEGARTPMLACGSCLFAAERGRARRGTQLQQAPGYGDREPYPLSARATPKRSMRDALVVPRFITGHSIPEQHLRRLNFIMPNA